jgi:hypothetical protein
MAQQLPCAAAFCQTHGRVAERNCYLMMVALMILQVALH